MAKEFSSMIYRNIGTGNLENNIYVEREELYLPDKKKLQEKLKEMDC